jgi:thiol-disulfide isomerase/thioredoxin
VLIDFWASWCGPCRRENPTVVRAYQKYKDKGFEIFSVSLDSDKTRWTQAIAQDGLVWPNHVSDLAGWRNAAAGAYGVSSIPATFLLDRNGNIVGTNLRGPALEARLSELLP